MNVDRKIKFKLIFLAILFFVFFGWAKESWAATEVVKTIKPSGQGGDYTTLAAWEAGEQRDLTAADEIAVAEIGGTWSTPDTTAVTIEGWTTDATRYIKIYTTEQARHRGKWSTDRYRLERTGAAARPLNNNQDFTRIDGLQVGLFGADGGSDGYGIRTGAKTGVSVSNCIIKDEQTGTAAAHEGIQTGGNLLAGQTIYVWNNIVYDFSIGSGVGIHIPVPATANAYIYNNTVYGCKTGYLTFFASTGAILKNNICQNCTDGFPAGNNASSDYNVSDLANDAPSSSYRNNLATVVTFVDEANDDFHLGFTDSGAKGNGTNLYADADLAVTTDIDGDSRPQTGAGATWDIGADQENSYVAVQSSNLPGGSKVKVNMSLADKMTDGLVGMWSFDGADMNWADTASEAKDRSGNGNDGDVDGATAAIGKRGQALSFDGASNHVSCGNVGTGLRSIAFWIKADDITSRKIIDFDGTDQIEIDGSSNILATSFPGTVTIYVDGSESSVIDSGWHHVVITDTIGVDGSALDLGRVSADYFDGSLDEIRVYNRTLSLDEVGDLYRLGQAMIRR